MKDLRIYINGADADLSEKIKPVISKIVSEYRNPTKKTGSFSYTLKLPKTQKNKGIFKFESDRQVLGKFRTPYSCYVTLNSVEIMSGEFVLNRITPDGFEGFISGTGEGRIADILDGNKTLRDVQTYEEIDFTGDAYVWERLDADLDGSNAEIAFPFVFDSFARIKYLNGGTVDGIFHQQKYDDFGISHFIRPLFTKIFSEVGYSVQGNVLDSETFRKMILLYSNKDGESPAYNYGKLNPLETKLYFNYFNQGSTFKGQDYSMYAIEPQPYGLWETDQSGDLSFSYGNDGVYTCKYTSNYTIEVKVESQATNVGLSNNPRLESKQFLVFREIDDNQYPEVSISDYSSLSYFNVMDADTLNVQSGTTSSESGNLHTHYTTFTARMVEGKQYRIQVMVAVKDSVEPEKMMLSCNPDNSYFKITECQGRQTLNPALFLPKMSQVDFIQAIFKVFSLFYSINEVEKSITLYTRDEWYELNKSNITDLSEKLSLNGFEETPLSENEIAETFYRWSTDDSDHLLTNTDYMSEVNADVSEDAYTLPFAPLSFIRQQIVTYSDDYIYRDLGYELLPVAIPATDSVDMSVVEDYTAASNFGYMPKLALYQGASHLKSGQMYYAGYSDAYGYNKLLIQFQRTKNLTGGTFYDTFGINRYKPIPKLSFFNVRNQPAYELEYIQATREFRLRKVTGDTIYTESDTGFLTDSEKVNSMDSVSLALSGEKSLFQQLYRNDVAVTDWSNFTEGEVRMNAHLFQSLTGRNIIRIDSDLYLLSAINNYDLLGEVAKVKLYRMVSA
ncbi:hypothetical protein EFA69_06610 [Rufibacter immobilis]|uniref:Uncharacterized protein n=1 Tax=Rufibacter immobilis TaxID=1348778 RepID=A0A3M9N1Q1_9BACT|nr:hypothetical protein [Rufibacter immobilis]RNI30958.1 hypothetical protein EFA69_06610 [Rufibacter immobilis]